MLLSNSLDPRKHSDNDPVLVEKRGDGLSSIEGFGRFYKKTRPILMFGKTLSTGEGGGVKWYADMHRFKFTSPNKINAISDNRITPNLTGNYCI